MYQYAVVQAVLLHQVLLSRFLSRLRAENARSKVAYVKGIVKYIFKRVFGKQNVGGGGGGGLCSSNFLPLLPLLRRICFWQINVERRLICFFIYIYILNFAGNSDLLCCKGVACVVFIYSCTIYISPLLQPTCLTYVFCVFNLHR